MNNPNPPQKQKCIWTGVYLRDTVEVQDRELDDLPLPAQSSFRVAPEHERAFRQFLDSYKRYAKPVLALHIALSISGFVSLMLMLSGDELELLWLAVIGGCVFCSGLLFAIMPLATPASGKWVSLQQTRSLTRYFGVLMAMVGLFLITVPLL